MSLKKQIYSKNLDHYSNLYSDLYGRYSFEVRSKLQILNSIVKKRRINFNRKKVLDIGFGYGDMLCAVNKKGAEAYGTEIVNPSILKLKKEHPTIKFLKGNIMHLPFKSNKFDFIICSHVIEHANNAKLAMNEIKRILKHSCTLILAIPIDDSKNEENELHKRNYSIHDIKEIVREVGFYINFCICYGSKLFQRVFRLFYFLINITSEKNKPKKQKKFKRKMYHKLLVPFFLFLYQLDNLIPFTTKTREIWLILEKR